MIPRICFPSEKIKATAAFTDNNGKALTSKNSQIYPVWRIIDQQGEFILGGIGNLNTKTRLYEAEFILPDYIKISADDGTLTQNTENQQEHPYMIEWEMVDITGKEWNVRETFLVGDLNFNTRIKEQQFITIPQSSLSLSIPIVRDMSNAYINFALYKDTDTNSQLWSVVPQLNGTYGEYYIYSVTIPAGIMSEDTGYLGVWQFSDSPFEKTSNNRNNNTYGNNIASTTFGNTSGLAHSFPVETGDITFFTQVITCTSLWSLKILSGMRMYLDHVQKNQDTYAGYQDSELLFHLYRGVEILNSVGLITQWTLQTWKSTSYLQGGTFWLLMAACYSALRSHYLAEVDLKFDYSGQPVSLSVDRSSDLDSFASSIKDLLDNEFKSTKNQIVKSYGKMIGTLNLTFPSINPNWLSFSRSNLGFGRLWQFGHWF